MVTTVRKQKTSLEEDLYKTSFNFEFHQAVKILELSHPKKAQFGETFYPEKEVAIIKSRIQLSYPPSDIYSIIPSKDNMTSTTMNINFMGIAGAGSPLPMPHTERIIKRVQAKDFATRDFLDIFNHRLISILHRIRKKYTIGLVTTTPETTGLGRALFALMGMSQPNQRNRFHFKDNTLLSFAGLFWSQHRSASGLKLILEKYFHIPVEVEQFVGVWQKIDFSDQTILGSQGQNKILGRSATLGRFFWNQQSKIVIKIGPLNKTEFLSFLKGGHLYMPLCELTRLYMGLQNSFAINLIMKASDILPSKLDGKTSLAWTSWLKKNKVKHNDDQVYFEPPY